MLTSCQETKDKKAEATEPEEPQNPLTEKFTEDEWKALKELRVRCYRCCPCCGVNSGPGQTKLPYIFETAFPEKEDKLSPVTLWGVPVDPSNPVGDARLSVILIKFLRARHVYIPQISVGNEFLSDECQQELKRGERDQHDDLDVQVA